MLIWVVVGAGMVVVGGCGVGGDGRGLVRDEGLERVRE